MAYRNYSVANGFTVAQDGSGDFTTIGAALTAASSGMDIFIRPGSYTEDLTLKAGVNLVAFTGDQEVPNVNIIGKATFTAAGTVCISNIRLVTNSDFLLVVSGSASSGVKLYSCRLSCTNNTGISHTTSGAGSQIQLFYCECSLGAVGVALFASTSAGSIVITGGKLSNAISSTPSSTTSSVTLYNTYFGAPFSTSGTGIVNAFNANITCSGVAVLTSVGTGTSVFSNCYLNSTTASVFSIGAGTTVDCSNSIINSSNANAVAGSGTFQYSNITFGSTSSTVQNTLTLSLQGTSPANAASGALLASTGTNTSPAYTLTPSVTSITLGGGTALADYEEGTFTPILSFGGASVGITYSIQAGTYTRTGNQVTFNSVITLSSKGSSTGVAVVSGLPIACGFYGYIFLCYLVPATTTGTYTIGKLLGSTSVFQINQVAATTGIETKLTNTAFSNTTSVYINGTYSV